jgi:5'-methylthioadenosine phosphorylase
MEQPGRGRPAVGIFGGSGFYRFLDDVEEVALETPYGPPSATIRVGQVEGSTVAFMPRHGDDHDLPPHRVNYRANVWAMREVGVRRIIGPSACGSLKPDLTPGTFVVADQFVDRTRGRADTFYEGPETTHVSAADPYCPDLRATLVEAARELDIPVADGGTVVVIQGPRFSTRSESRWFSAAGWDVVNMTQYPEAWLARELELCYANVSLVTDYDVGLEGMPDVEPVSAEAAFRVFADNLDRLRALLFRAVPRIGPQPEDVCATALASAIVHQASPAADRSAESGYAPQRTTPGELS